MKLTTMILDCEDISFRFTHHSLTLGLCSYDMLKLATFFDLDFCFCIM
jgi:hypothetical protein